LLQTKEDKDPFQYCEANKGAELLMVAWQREKISYFDIGIYFASLFATKKVLPSLFAIGSKLHFLFAVTELS
jgi:hypothetical protein